MAKSSKEIAGCLFYLTKNMKKPTRKNYLTAGKTNCLTSIKEMFYMLNNYKCGQNNIKKIMQTTKHKKNIKPKRTHI